MATRPEKMKNVASCRFDVAALREIAGEKVFRRGIAYHEDGAAAGRTPSG